LSEEQTEPTASWTSSAPVGEDGRHAPTEGHPYPARPVREGVDIVVRRPPGYLGLLVVTAVTLAAGFGLAYVSNRHDASAARKKSTPNSTVAAPPTTARRGGRVGSSPQSTPVAPVSRAPRPSAAQATLVTDPLTATTVLASPVASPVLQTSVPDSPTLTTLPTPTTVPAGAGVSPGAAQASAPGVPKSLYESVARVRFVSSDGTPCGEASGVFLSADGLLLTTRAPVTCGASVDVLISQSASPTDALSVRYRGHAVVDSEPLGVALVQIDRDGQGRRFVPRISTFATLAHAMPPAASTAGLLLSYAEPGGAVLRSDPVLMRSSETAGAANDLVIEIGTLTISYGGAVFDGAGHLVGVVLPAGLKNGQVLARSVAALGNLLQRVGVDYVPIRP
jgi:hypothetical protein